MLGGRAWVAHRPSQCAGAFFTEVQIYGCWAGKAVVRRAASRWRSKLEGDSLPARVGLAPSGALEREAAGKPNQETRRMGGVQPRRPRVAPPPHLLLHVLGLLHG